MVLVTSRERKQSESRRAEHYLRENDWWIGNCCICYIKGSSCWNVIIYAVSVDSCCLSLLNACYVFPPHFLNMYNFFVCFFFLRSVSSVFDATCKVSIV